MQKFKASEVYNHMTTGTRKNNETYYYFKDSAPKEMRESWLELTGNFNDYSFADLDEYYSILYTLVSIMKDYGYEFTEDTLYEIDWRDDFNGERLMWLYNNLERANIYDEIKNNGADGIFELIGDMQDFSRGDFAGHVFNNFIEV